MTINAAIPSPARTYSTLWPFTDTRQEWNAGNMPILWAKARNLYYNYPVMAMAVKALVQLAGILMPLPCSSDEEWNKEARKAFLQRMGNASLCEASGRLNWKQIQLWRETRAIVDGDCLTVLGKGADGGAQIALYAAPQVWGGDSTAPGVELDRRGRATAYYVADESNKKSVRIPANSAILYQHNPDPANPRGLTELVAAINTIQDIGEINGLHKQSVKAAAAVAFVEEKSISDDDAAASIIKASMAGEDASEDETETTPEPPLMIAGSAALSLAPGRKLSILHDDRPSQNVREFVKDLVRDVAYSVGVDPEAVFFVAGMGSASARFSLQKTREQLKNRNTDAEVWATRIYQHTILLEIAAGRLRPCPTPDGLAVRWIARQDWTIDKGRDGALMLKLVAAGLADANEWTLATEGRTFEEIATSRIHDLAHIQQRAQEVGLTLGDILPETYKTQTIVTDTGTEEAAVPEYEPEDPAE